MQKAGFFRGLFLIVVVLLCFGKASNAQISADTLGFTWKLLEVTDPTSGAKIQFTSLVSSTATIKSWSFGDGSTSTEASPTHSFTSIDTFDVALNFTLNAKDSTITQKVIANPAFFFIKQDSSLMNLVTYKRVFRSGFLIQKNDPALLGNMRFEWAVNGTILDNVSFDNSAFGQYPNIYYTFERPGINTVTLRVWNIADATKSISLTRTINIQPDFTTKVKIENIPNVFTPNGDNIHDYFEVTTSGTSRLKFMVYSRAGALIYQNESSIIKWDGKNDNGKELPEGIYFYIIEDLDGFYQNAKGFFYIFRGK